MSKRLFALGRLRKNQMNKTEARYDLFLKDQLHRNVIQWYSFQGMTFKLADDTRYTPDFMVLNEFGQLEAHEVKGSKFIFQDDAKVKCKVMAQLFPIQVFVCFPDKFTGWRIEQC